MWHLRRHSGPWWGIACLLVGCGGAPDALSPTHSAEGTSLRNRGVAHGGWYPDAHNGLRIPGGETCVSWLQQLGIPFVRLDPKPGVETPVEVTGPIGGIRYISEGRDSIVCDCRLVLALDWSSRVLRPLGVERIAHMGAYVHRTTRRGRPSLHARGLAIDVGAIQVGREWLEVEHDFERGSRCDSGENVLNSVSCRLRSLHLFRELITPDDDSDHRNHLHLALPLRGQP